MIVPISVCHFTNDDHMHVTYSLQKHTLFIDKLTFECSIQQTTENVLADILTRLRPFLRTSSAAKGLKFAD